MNRRHRCGRMSLLAVGLMLWGQAALAEEIKLPHADEQAAWEKIADRFTGKPEAKQDRQGRLQRIEVRGFKLDKPDKGWARVTLDPETGHVIEVASDRAGFTNDEFQLFMPFKHLHKLTLWHNKNFHDKDAPVENYDASGLKYLKELPKLQRITLAGGGFGDEGMRAAAELPHLKYLGMWHCRVTDAGIAHLEKHPAFESIRLGPFWAERITDKSLASLASCPQIKEISLSESYLTYENGLKHLVAVKETLQLLDLRNSLLEPADVEKIKAALPETEVRWEGLAAGGAILQASGWHLGKAKKWMPPELIERALKAAPAESGK